MFEVQSCVRGYHVYQNVWTLSVVECVRESRNYEDPYAVATKTSTSGMVVGNVPRRVSYIFSTFLCHDGYISVRHPLNFRKLCQ